MIEHDNTNYLVFFFILASRNEQYVDIINEYKRNSIMH